jgi:hypothetical protein
MEMDCYNSKNQVRIGVLALSLFILAWGIVWMGNDLGWWHISFPFWPVVVILIGLVILISELRKTFLD